MPGARLLLVLLLTAVPLTTTHTANHEGDFAFDSNDDPLMDSTEKSALRNDCPVRRLWGVPDMPAYIGHMFHLRIPKEAFSGKVIGYKASGVGGPLPSWLWVDGHHGTIRGVPGLDERGEHRVLVTALPENKKSQRCPPATDIFTIEVKDKRDSPMTTTHREHQCHLGEDETKLVIIISKPFHQITPKQRLNAIMKIAHFMALDYNAFSIQPHEVFEDKEGNHDVGAKKKHSKASSEIVLTVGCSGVLWTKHSILVHQIKQQVTDGTISDVIHLPVKGWRVIRYKQLPFTRSRRQALEGSAYDDEEMDEGDDMTSGYDEYDSEYENEDEMFQIPLQGPSSGLISPSVPTLSLIMDPPMETETSAKEVAPATPALPPAPPPTPPTPPHHHRHHHGETFTTVLKEFTPRIVVTENTPPNMDTELVTPDSVDVVIEEETEHHAPITHSPVLEYTTPSEADTFPPSPATPRSVEIPPNTEIIPTDEITTLAGTPQMEGEASSPPLPSTASPPATVGVADPPRVTFATYTTLPTEDTTIYTTYAITQQTTDKDIQIIPEQSNKTSTFSDNVSVRKHAEVSHGVPVILPAVDNSTEEVKKQTDELTIVPIVPDDLTTPETKNVPSPTEWDQEITVPTTPVSEVSKTVMLDFFVPTTPKDTTLADINTTERSSTIFGRTTETVEFNFPTNSPPEKQHRTKKVAVTSGKYFSYIIPEDLFIDAEDGTNLQLTMYDIEHIPLKSSSWVQFDSKTREVYGLPLEEHVSKWEYIIEATDSKGASVTDTLDITVQQHKGRRAVNHEFSIKLRIEKKYPAVVDWQIRALKGLVDLFRDTDMDQITVRGVDLESDPIEFMWTNDTLPKHFCPRADILRLMDILQSNRDGDPSPALTNAMSPELRVKSVSWRGTGACTPPPTLNPPPHPDNFGPMPRNQIDHINATCGKLLVFKVPEDTFYDPEDGSARNLKMSLIRGDRSVVPNHYWLQFDSKNQEFFGVPLEKDIGRREYQLIAEDSGGLTANDGLLVEVHPAPPIKATVEFQMTLDPPSQNLLKYPLSMRSFIESLQQLFGDGDASSILIKSITSDPTVVSWYNTSLPVDRCPEEEINKLRKFLVGDDAILTQRADDIMGQDFPVISISMEPLGACSPETTFIKTPDITHYNKRPNEDASKPIESDDYLITFIVPIVVIVCMILIASLIACVLYKRRRTGKMSVGDDEERQAFRSKGIPVIFQDELDEKPDPSNKSPVIMKEEKPPLLPPPEYKGMDSNSPTPSHTPYHPPPPPFTASRDTARNSRPKPTPTYRKPPPYVPP